MIDVSLNAPSTYNTIAEDYNIWAAKNGKKTYDRFGQDITIDTVTCKVVNFLKKTYGKYPNVDIESTVIMEYSTFIDYTVNHINPKPNNDFKDYLAERPTILDDYADLLMYTLPLPRY